jgi:hypothetical protein
MRFVCESLVLASMSAVLRMPVECLHTSRPRTPFLLSFKCKEFLDGQEAESFSEKSCAPRCAEADQSPCRGHRCRRQCEMYVTIPEDRDERCVQVFGTFTRELAAITQWLKQCKVTMFHVKCRARQVVQKGPAEGMALPPSGNAMSACCAIRIFEQPCVHRHLPLIPHA